MKCQSFPLVNDIFGYVSPTVNNKTVLTYLTRCNFSTV